MYLYGHRGAKDEAPENTLAGFQHLRNLGIHCVELDVHLNHDNVPVVIHDKKLSRTTNAKGLIKGLSTADLIDVDARGHWKHHWSEPQRIPTLDEVLSAWPQLQSVQLEVKTENPEEFPIMARALIDLCNKHQLLQRGIITSKYPAFLQYLKASHCPQPKGFVALRTDRQLIQKALDLECHYLCLKQSVCTPELFNNAHKAGLKICVWTVNRLKQHDKFKRWGADSIITDVPSYFLNALKTNKNSIQE